MVGTCVAAALLVGSFLSTGIAASQDTGLQSKRDQREYTGKNVPPGEYYTGRSPFNLFRRSAPATPPPAAPAQPTGRSCAEVSTELLHMTKTMPREVSLGETFTYVLKVTARDCLADVVVTDTIPDGAEYVSSDPKATKT